MNDTKETNNQGVTTPVKRTEETYLREVAELQSCYKEVKQERLSEKGSLRPLKLEQVQQRMLLAISHSEGEVRKEFVCFLCAFCDKLDVVIERVKCGLRPRLKLSKAEVRPWFKIFNEYCRMCGFPEEHKQELCWAVAERNAQVLKNVLYKVVMTLQGVE